MPTRSHDVPNSAWTLVSTGACFVEVQNHTEGRLHVGPVEPALDTADYHTLRIGNPFSYSGTESVWVRSAADRAAKVIVTSAAT